MTGRLLVFIDLRRLRGVSHEVRWGAERASLVEPGKSGLHGSGEGEPVIALESW